MEPIQSTPTELSAEIERLHELKERGVLTADEFAKAKENVLNAPQLQMMSRDRMTGGHKSGKSKSSGASRSSKSHDGSATGRHAKASKSRSSRSSSTSSSSSSSSSSSGRGFIVPQRTDVWRVTKQGLQPEYPVPGITPVTRDAPHGFDKLDESTTPQIASPVGTDPHMHSGSTPLKRNTSFHESFAAHGGKRGGASTRQSFGGANEKRPAYGTFTDHRAAKARQQGEGVRLLPKEKVYVQYFNSRGDRSANFEDVQFQSEYDSERVAEDDPLYKEAAGAAGGLTQQPAQPGQPGQPGQPQPPAGKPRSEASALHNLDVRSHSSHSSSELVLSFDWYWVDVVGRDEANGRRTYNQRMAEITERFGLCPSLLVDREHTLVLPQFVEAATNPHQYLVVLRVATPKINLTADSVVELTNRWIIVVDLQKKVVITIHRWDTLSMAQLRAQWKHLMSQSIAFEEFLLKILDDASTTFSSSVDIHQGLLDECEAKLLMTSTKQKQLFGANSSRGVRRFKKEMAAQILSLFEDGAENSFLASLLDGDGKGFEREEMNQFLYHLHRRSGVQHRMLVITQPVLLRCFTKFRLCSRDRSSQLGGYCNDLAAKALEVRDNAKHLLDMHISLVSFHTNELMALLTRFEIFFAPLEFLAAVYGMNFATGMWELEWQFGYYMFWGLCALSCILVYTVFHRRF